MARLSIDVVEARDPLRVRTLAKTSDPLELRVSVRVGGRVDFRYYVLDETGLRPKKSEEWSEATDG